MPAVSSNGLFGTFLGSPCYLCYLGVGIAIALGIDSSHGVLGARPKPTYSMAAR